MNTIQNSTRHSGRGDHKAEPEQAATVTGLIRYDAMCEAIAACYTVDEVKEIRNKARALEVYAQQALNVEAERKAAEIRIRAERKAGELLREMKQNGTRDSGGKGRIESRPPTHLKDIRITRDQSSEWQRRPGPRFPLLLGRKSRQLTELRFVFRSNTNWY